MRQYL